MEVILVPPAAALELGFHAEAEEDEVVLEMAGGAVGAGIVGGAMGAAVGVLAKAALLAASGEADRAGDAADCVSWGVGGTATLSLRLEAPARESPSSGNVVRCFCGEGFGNACDEEDSSLLCIDSAAMSSLPLLPAPVDVTGFCSFRFVFGRSSPSTFLARSLRAVLPLSYPSVTLPDTTSKRYD